MQRDRKKKFVNKTKESFVFDEIWQIDLYRFTRYEYTVRRSRPSRLREALDDKTIFRHRRAVYVSLLPIHHDSPIFAHFPLIYCISAKVTKHFTFIWVDRGFISLSNHIFLVCFISNFGRELSKILKAVIQKKISYDFLHF